MTDIRRCNRDNVSDNRVAGSKSYCYSKGGIAHSSPGAINRSSGLKYKAMLKNESTVSEGKEDAS